MLSYDLSGKPISEWRKDLRSKPYATGMPISSKFAEYDTVTQEFRLQQSFERMDSVLKTGLCMKAPNAKSGRL